MIWIFLEIVWKAILLVASFDAFMLNWWCEGLHIIWVVTIWTLGSATGVFVAFGVLDIIIAPLKARLKKSVDWLGKMSVVRGFLLWRRKHQQRNHRRGMRIAKFLLSPFSRYFGAFPMVALILLLLFVGAVNLWPIFPFATFVTICMVKLFGKSDCGFVVIMLANIIKPTLNIFCIPWQDIISYFRILL